MSLFGGHRDLARHVLPQPVVAFMSCEDSIRNDAWERLNPVPPDDVLFGRSAAMAEVRSRAEKISRMNIPILLTGEGGTGKEAIARWIHAHSDCASGNL